jgi:1-acyl-sn-glycerol-3-phosphate acyltransferase
VPLRRQKTDSHALGGRVKDAAVEVAREVAREAPQLAREGQERVVEVARAVASLDVRWARSRPALWARERFMAFVMNPILDHYAARRSTGFDVLTALNEPVILVANHASHMDTPVILSALPRKLRRRTAVAAAADYFYRYRIVAWLISLAFNTVPIERKGGGHKSMGHLDRLLDDGWSLLLFPEGTRSHGNGPGRVRRGAAILAAHHNLPIVPIRVTGTAAAMPPGTFWPKRLRGRLLTRRHRIEVSFGDPIQPIADTAALIEKVQQFFDAGEVKPASRSRLLRRKRKSSGD